jgi:hypothetical protein
MKNISKQIVLIMDASEYLVTGNNKKFLEEWICKMTSRQCMDLMLQILPIDRSKLIDGIFAT